MQRALVTAGVAVISDDAVDAAPGTLRVHRNEVAEPGTLAGGFTAQCDMVDPCRVHVAAEIALAGKCGIGIGGLRDVVARSWIVWALHDRDVRMVVVGKVADDLCSGSALETRIVKIVERWLAGWAIRCWSAVHIDVHAMGQDLEGGRRRLRSQTWYNRVNGKQNEGKYAPGIRQEHKRKT